VTILVVFATLALGLAAVGLYGVMAATVSQSTRELALRIALGADAADLLRLVMSRSVVLTAVGIVVGIAVALQVTRLLGYLLYNVNPRDPLARRSTKAGSATSKDRAKSFAPHAPAQSRRRNRDHIVALDAFNRP
jgi:ABC-type antimicrobial peptide transport system permease subunit